MRALENVFALRTHRENQTKSLYELTVASTGSKLQAEGAPVAEDPGGRFEPGSIHRGNIALDEFVRLISLRIGRPVVNKTNLSGLFHVTLDWPPLPRERSIPVATPPANTTNLPSLFQAVQEQLGPPLTPSDGTIEVIVVDRAAAYTPRVVLAHSM